MISEAMSLVIPAAIMGIVALTALPVGVATGALLGVAGSTHLWRTRASQ